SSCSSPTGATWKRSNGCSCARRARHGPQADIVLAVANVLGLLLASFSASCLLPLACSLWFRDGQWSSFLITAAVGAGGGALLAGATFRFRRELKPRDG